MYRGRVRLTIPMVYAIGFMMLFVIGGLTGIILANPSIDYQIHNTLFLVAHFHNMLVPGTLFGMLAGYNFWFPKAFGFCLEERWGYRAAYSWIVGYMLAFFPLYALGLLGMPRRTVAFFEPAYLPWTIIAGVGALVVLFALFSLVMQLGVSIRRRAAYAVPVGDPWDGFSLEWSTSAPPPEYNFPVIPQINSRDPFLSEKDRGQAYQRPDSYTDIEMPANSALGPILAGVGFLMAFGLVWYMWWLVIGAGLIGLTALIARSFVRRTTRVIGADEIRRTHESWLDLVAHTHPIKRADERSMTNRGLAKPPVDGAVQ